MTFLLDTNVVSEMRKAGDGRANANVAMWLSRQDKAALCISVITVLELERGVLLMERRNRQQGALLRAWLSDQVLPAFLGRILPIDTAVARCCAGLHVPNPRPERDALITATVLVYGVTLVTRNIADFQGINISLVDPWNPAAN